MTTTAGLAAAIDGLYSAFQTYIRPPTFVGCDCCWDGEPTTGGSAVVRSPGGTRPLRDLTADELVRVGAQMPHLGGDVDVFRHYLPRLLEIGVTDGFEFPTLEMLLSRLSDVAVGVCWTDWPDDEQTAVRRFLHALWRDRLATPVDPDIDGRSVIDEALCGIGGADPDIDWYLDEWLRFDQPYAARHLEQFLALNGPRLTKRRRLENAWWRRDHSVSAANHDRIVEWIRSPAMSGAVAAASNRPLPKPEQDALTECYLRWL